MKVNKKIIDTNINTYFLLFNLYFTSKEVGMVRLILHHLIYYFYYYVFYDFYYVFYDGFYVP